MPNEMTVRARIVSPEVIAAPMSDAAMLETLATWFDAKYPNDDVEVQLDLRRIASRLRRLDGKISTVSNERDSQTTEDALRAEIARLRSLVVKLYAPACDELGPACEDIDREFSDVIEMAMEYG